MKEGVTKVIDTLTQEDVHGVFQKLLERYNKCNTAGVDYFEGDLSFMCVLSIKVPIRSKSGNLFNDPHMSYPLGSLTTSPYGSEERIKSGNTFIYEMLSAHGVMVISVGNGHSDTSSNPGRD